VLELSGVVVSGVGRAATFMDVPWVREGARALLGFDPYPGTLNVRLRDADAVRAWTSVAPDAPLLLVPPPSESCGARLYRAHIPPDLTAAVIVPDIPGYPADTLELIAPVHVRTRLGLRDGDVLTLRIGDAQRR
jgi:riboflavin kinase, archaea type